MDITSCACSRGSHAIMDARYDPLTVSVRLVLEEGVFEDVVVMNGSSFEQAVLRATQRALGFPEDECWLFTGVEVFPGAIDLFANPRKPYEMYSGVRLTVTSPEGEEVSGDYRASSLCPDRSLGIAMAFAGILRRYHTTRGIEARESPL